MAGMNPGKLIATVSNSWRPFVMFQYFRWEGTGKVCCKLTKFNIAAATEFLDDHHLSYILPAIFSQDPLK